MTEQINEPPDLPELLPIDDTDLFIVGYPINLPPALTYITFEEAFIEFKWTDNPETCEEVFLLP